MRAPVSEPFPVDGYWWKDITHMPSGSVWTYGLENDLHRIAERAQGTMDNKYHPEKHNVNDINYYDKWGRIGANDWIGHRSYALIIFPGEARQFYAAGMKSKNDLKKYIANYRRWPWEKLDSHLQESMLELAKSGKVPYLTVDDCKPGGSVPVYNADKLAIFVSGPMAGQTLGFYCMATYKSFSSNAPSVPYFTKKITGATLTKAGR